MVPGMLRAAMLRSLLPLIGLLASFPVAVQGIPIFIANHSFEDTIVPDGSYTVNTVPGWLGEGSWYHVANPTDAQFAGTTDSGPGGSLVEGRNVAAVNNFGHLLYQDLIVPLLPHHTYTLTVSMGHRNNVPVDSSISLLAGGRFLARGFANPPEGQFVDVSVVYNSPNMGDFIGDNLIIELRSAGTISQGWFDNVRLDVVASAPGTVVSTDTPYVPIPADHPDYAASGGLPRPGFTSFTDNGSLSIPKVPESGSVSGWLGAFGFGIAALLVVKRQERARRIAMAPLPLAGAVASVGT
jgi:hypothetical protein